MLPQLQRSLSAMDKGVILSRFRHRMWKSSLSNGTTTQQNIQLNGSYVPQCNLLKRNHSFHKTTWTGCYLLKSYKPSCLTIYSSVRNSSTSLLCRKSNINYQRQFTEPGNVIHSSCSSCKTNQKPALNFHQSFTRDYETCTYYVVKPNTVRTRPFGTFARNYSVSTLYVGHYNSHITAVVEVDLDLEAMFSDVRKLDSEVLARRMDINVYELHSKYKKLQELHKKKKFIEDEREKTAEQVKVIFQNKKKSRGDVAILEKSEDDAAKGKELAKYGKELKEKLKPLAKEYNLLEEEVMLEALKLPVELHPDVPKEPVILKELGHKPKFNFKSKSHVEIAEKTHTVEFSSISPGAYYLKQHLADWSHDIMCFLDDFLQDCDLTPVVCPDMVRTLVLEGCGQQWDDPRQVYTLENNVECDGAEESSQGNLTKHLVGVSPMGFIAYLTKMNILQKCLPLRYYSIGTSYSPKPLNNHQDYPNLLLVPQALVAELFGCCSDKTKMEEMYRKYTEIMEQFYIKLNLPVRVIQSATEDLDPMESSRTEVQIWMPSLKQYVKVGFVSTWNDYASRRLCIKYNSSLYDVYTRNYVFTVHGTLVHMPTLIAALMENYQTQNGKFQIPDHLLNLRRTKTASEYKL